MAKLEPKAKMDTARISYVTAFVLFLSFTSVHCEPSTCKLMWAFRLLSDRTVYTLFC